MKVIISGGGTGGHVFPAIAIADALKEKDKLIEILFVGAKGRIEMDKVPKAGYEIEGLWITGFQRKFSLRNLSFPFKLIHSLWRSSRILNRFKPDVVVGVGGFASGPVLEMAIRKGYPTLIQEQNSFPGITNKLLGKRVNKICVAYEKMGRFFPEEVIMNTGNPVRKDLLDLSGKRNEGIAHFGLDPAKKTIMVTGGSLGARTLNEATAGAFDLIKDKHDIQVLWQVGKLYEESFGQVEMAKLPHVKQVLFIDRMDLAYAMSDLVICRAGASTISEICLAGKAVILVPSPNVAEDHQRKNAEAMMNMNAASMVLDKDANESLWVEALELLADENKRNDYSERIKSFGKPNAAEVIANEVLQLANAKS